MAEGGGEECPHHFSPLEEQLIREVEEEEAAAEAQIQREKEMASQKLWCAFQDSATAVAHLFRDCQQQAGLAAWVPFQDSASAVTQLYKGSLEVCRQCVECGVKHGQRKRTRDIVTWLKKKRRVIRRDELLAFLLDKPYTPDHSNTHHSQNLYFGCGQSDSLTNEHHHFTPPPPPPPIFPPHSTSSHHHALTRPLPCIDGLNFPPPVSLPMIPVTSPNPCYTGHLPSPRSRWALFGRDEQGLQNEGEMYASSGGRESVSGRKRLNSSSAASGNLEFSQESPPLAKRMKI